MSEKTIKLFGYECRIIFNTTPGLPITFLHGYSFTSDIWNEIEVFQLLTKNEIPFLAIDMPYGKRSKSTPKTRKSEENVSVLKEALYNVFGSDKTILVGASLGGYIALKYSMKNPVQGMLLVAPVRSLQEELVQGYRKLLAPVYIIYGTKDRVVSLKEMENLRDVLPNAELFIYEDSNHPAYLDNPYDFKKHLMEIYDKSG